MLSYNNNGKIILIRIWPFVGVHSQGNHNYASTSNNCVFGSSHLSCTTLKRGVSGCCLYIKAPPPPEKCVFFLVCWLHSQHNFTQLRGFISAKFSCFWANWSSKAVRAELYNHAGHRAMGISSHNHQQNSQKKSASVHKLTPQPAEHPCRRIYDTYLHSAPLHEANFNLQISW